MAGAIRRCGSGIVLVADTASAAAAEAVLSNVISDRVAFYLVCSDSSSTVVC